MRMRIFRLFGWLFNASIACSMPEAISVPGRGMISVSSSRTAESKGPATVECQRALQEGIARKCDQAETDIGNLFGKIGDGQLGPFQPVRFHVFGQHAFGAVRPRREYRARSGFPRASRRTDGDAPSR